MTTPWRMDPDLVPLNHGSFGAVPTPVFKAQGRWRERIERDPMRFYLRELGDHLDEARAELAAFVGADPAGLVFVDNATSGVNAVLRSFDLSPGDELLTTSHAYPACKLALRYVAERSGASVVVADVPFPVTGPGPVLAAILERVSDRTRLALLDHVTSPTGLVFPIRDLVGALAERGVPTLVDGAHAPGMLDLRVDALGAAFYTGNCHKWLCAPRGSGFLVVREEWRERILPLQISYGYGRCWRDSSRFHHLFDWTGTDDPTAWLCVPEALRFLEGLVPGGWPALRERNRSLALEGQAILCEALGIEPPAPAAMIGTLASVPLPEQPRSESGSQLAQASPLQLALYDRYAIEAPVFAWPAKPRRLLRISAHAYNARPQYEHLADALTTLLAEGM